MLSVGGNLGELERHLTLKRYGLRKVGKRHRCGSKLEKRIASKAVRRANKDRTKQELVCA